MLNKAEIDRERALFQSEALRLDIIDEEGLERDDAGDYIDDPANAAWKAWQAARATTPPAPAPTLAGEGDAWRSVGSKMSNVMFNLSQRKDMPDAKLYGEIYREWDAAIRAVPRQAAVADDLQARQCGCYGKCVCPLKRADGEA